MDLSIQKNKPSRQLSILISMFLLTLNLHAGSLMDRSTSSSDSAESTNKNNNTQGNQGGDEHGTSQTDGSGGGQNSSSKPGEQNKQLIDRSQAGQNTKKRGEDAQTYARDQDQLESARLSNDPEGGLDKKGGFGNAGSKALGLAGGAASAGAGALGSLGAAGLGGLGALGSGVLGIGAGGLMALKLLSQGIVSSPICFTACNRLACKSSRVRAMCESKCSANPAAIKKCLAQGS